MILLFDWPARCHSSGSGLVFMDGIVEHMLKVGARLRVGSASTLIGGMSWWAVLIPVYAAPRRSELTGVSRVWDMWVLMANQKLAWIGQAHVAGLSDSGRGELCHPQCMQC